MAIGRKTGGRVAGTPNHRTTELLERTAAEGITPLEVMVATMREFWERALKTRGAAREQLLMLASEEASRAAPYLHHRLQSIDAKVTTKSADPLDMTDAELMRIAAGGRRAPDAEPEDSPEEPDRVH